MKSAVKRAERKDLFEILRQRTGALYISDLRYSPYRERAIHLAAQENAENHSRREWNDALEYLLFHAGCATVEEARQLFVKADERL